MIKDLMGKIANRENSRDKNCKNQIEMLEMKNTLREEDYLQQTHEQTQQK